MSLLRLTLLVSIVLGACRPVAPPSSSPRSGRVKVFVGGTVIHTEPGTASRATLATVVVEGDRIVRVGPAAAVAIPPGAEVIDARGKFLIPGLVDAHIHFFQSGGLHTRPDILDLRRRVPYAEEQRRIRRSVVDTLRRYLASGVTTVVDVGGPMWNFDVRERARRIAAAPRVFVTGPLIASYQPAALTTADPAIVRVETRDQALALVRKQLARRPDLIKIWYVVSKQLALDLETFYPIVEAIVEESHRHGVKVWVHATELETARRALQAGADVLVHNVTDREVDPPFVELARRRAIVIPTLWVFSAYPAVFTERLQLRPAEHRLAHPATIGTLLAMGELAPSELSDRARRFRAARPPLTLDPVQAENVRRLHRRGVPLAAGTDAGNIGVLHGPAIYRDLVLMRQAGLSNHEVLVAATLNGARLLGREREQGSIEPGKLADLLLLDADPLEDIQRVAAIHRVVKGGQVFAPDDLLAPTPEDLAQQQLNAYNARDLDAFVARFAPDVEVYDHPSTLLFRGRAALRQRYDELFRRAPALHCKLLGRTVAGDRVTDREEVTGIPGRGTVHATAIYEVAGRLIRRVWFVK
jgi:imidazolonepropionase-like amidohydrolase